MPKSLLQAKTGCMANLLALWTLNPMIPSSSPGKPGFLNSDISVDQTEIRKKILPMKPGRYSGRNTAMEEKGWNWKRWWGGVGVGVDFIINNVDPFYYYYTSTCSPQPSCPPNPAAKPVPRQH